MHLINKIFNNETIRTVWDKEKEKYYISIVDLVGVLSESDRPRKYWSDLKNKLKQEGNEVSEKIGQLKLKSQDGKYRLTDVCDIKDLKYFRESYITPALEEGLIERLYPNQPKHPKQQYRLTKMAKEWLTGKVK